MGLPWWQDEFLRQEYLLTGYVTMAQDVDRCVVAGWPPISADKANLRA